MPIGSTNEEDPEGDWQTSKIQTKRRVVIDKEYLEHHDMEVGDECIVICTEDGVEVKPNDDETLKGLIED